MENLTLQIDNSFKILQNLMINIKKRYGKL